MRWLSLSIVLSESIIAKASALPPCARGWSPDQTKSSPALRYTGQVRGYEELCEHVSYDCITEREYSQPYEIQSCSPGHWPATRLRRVVRVRLLWPHDGKVVLPTRRDPVMLSGILNHT